jgi:hypothetical protein
MSRSQRIIALAFSMTLAFALDAFAQTRTETLRWTHPASSDVTGFKVHYGPTSRNYTVTQDVGIPAAVSGAFEYQIQVAADADVYVAITAYDPDAESFFSNESCRGPDGACTTPPPPEEPPTDPNGPQAAVTGFVLWDAASDTVIDSSFQSGDQFSLADYGCTAVEIKGNSYLSGSGPGSVMYTFDGQEPSACDEPGATYENNSPFVWGVELSSSNFDCAPTLTQPGKHSLKVTPFDGDTCSGVQGTPVTVEFEILDSSTAPASIGQPGRPVLILD